MVGKIRHVRRSRPSRPAGHTSLSSLVPHPAHLPRPPWVSGSRGRCSRHVRVALGLARSPVPSARTGQPAPRDTKAKGTRDSLTPQAYPPQSSQGGAAPTRSVYSLSLRRSQTSARTTPRCTLCVRPQHGPRGPCRRPRGGRVVVACAAHSPPPTPRVARLKRTQTHSLTRRASAACTRCPGQPPRRRCRVNCPRACAHRPSPGEAWLPASVSTTGARRASPAEEGAVRRAAHPRTCARRRRARAPPPRPPARPVPRRRLSTT